MKTLIKWLCYIYFSIHEDVSGLILYSNGFGFGIKIKKEGDGE